MSSDLYASPEPQRLAFIALTQNRRFASRAPATVAIKPPGGVLGPYAAAPLHRDGLPTDRGVYVVQPVLAKAGVYSATIKTAGQTIELPFQVQPKPHGPAVGSIAPAAASPTTTKPLGVKPLCTRKPMCPLHSRSLDEVIGKGRPVAVMFATPALCQSAYCGPVLDTLLPIVTRLQDRIDFVHVEIYRDMTGTNVSPTVTAWNLSSEPWLFAVDPTGKIVSRLDGAFASDEIETVLRQLTPA
ncbi:MAG: hypothetical protein JWL83_29 [Actinomycetia bacterium]|nr:hypothetical protein [Actinomycetes bacterium]